MDSYQKKRFHETCDFVFTGLALLICLCTLAILGTKSDYTRLQRLRQREEVERLSKSIESLGLAESQHGLPMQ